MTGNTEWGLRSNQDDPDSNSFGGQNVFDVYTKSHGTAPRRHKVLHMVKCTIPFPRSACPSTLGT